jgi:hypothetical protein
VSVDASDEPRRRYNAAPPSAVTPEATSGCAQSVADNERGCLPAVPSQPDLLGTDACSEVGVERSGCHSAAEAEAEHGTGAPFFDVVGAASAAPDAAPSPRAPLDTFDLLGDNGEDGVAAVAGGERRPPASPSHSYDLLGGGWTGAVGGGGDAVGATEDVVAPGPAAPSQRYDLLGSGWTGAVGEGGDAVGATEDVDALNDFFQAGAATPPSSVCCAAADASDFFGDVEHAAAATNGRALVRGVAAPAARAGPEEPGDLYLERMVVEAQAVSVMLPPDRARKVMAAIASAHDYVAKRMVGPCRLVYSVLLACAQRAACSAISEAGVTHGRSRWPASGA